MTLSQCHKQKQKGCCSCPQSSCLSPHTWGRSSGWCHSPLNGSIPARPHPHTIVCSTPGSSEWAARERKKSGLCEGRCSKGKVKAGIH
ncbi:hypothetical protein NPIL_469871 [Nephila pilipes]|uniref:Uncharacterized protein n=1 Tax=Nephila pilipes TaxID=299642 RepID=A0A8X6NGS5_NEPPI|nr:hypothetical protein NPIL_469871 [Nephila pilipes]